MSETTTKPKAKRRRDSAIAGGVFLSQRDLEGRWGCNSRTASARIKDAGIPQYLFSEKSVRYKLCDVEIYERQALAAGFMKKSEQIKRQQDCDQRDDEEMLQK